MKRSTSDGARMYARIYQWDRMRLPPPQGNPDKTRRKAEERDHIFWSHSPSSDKTDQYLWLCDKFPGFIVLPRTQDSFCGVRPSDDGCQPDASGLRQQLLTHCALSDLVMSVPPPATTYPNRHRNSKSCIYCRVAHKKACFEPAQIDIEHP